MDYKFCKKCGALLSVPDAKFCTSCGALQDTVEKKRSPTARFFLTLLQCLGFWGFYFTVDLIVSGVFVLICAIRSYGAVDYESAYSQFFGSAYPIVSIVTLLLVVAGYVGFYAIRKKNFFKEVKFQKTKFSAVIWLFVAGILANFVVVGGLSVLYTLFPSLTDYSVSDNFEAVYKDVNPILEFVEVAIIVPIFEEILFRGIIYTRLRKAVPKAAAILMGGVIFAAAHMNLEQFCYVLPLGLLMCLSYEKFNSIFVTIAIHIGFNAGNELINAFLADVPTPWFAAIAIAALAIVAVILACLFLIKKEENPEYETV